jgi:hypothetical protein
VKSTGCEVRRLALSADFSGAARTALLNRRLVSLALSPLSVGMLEMALEVSVPPNIFEVSTPALLVLMTAGLTLPV